MQSLVELARQQGVTLVTDAKVEHIEHHQNQVRAVKLLDGTRLSADIVIANCEVADVSVMLDEPQATHLKPKDRSMSGLVFLLGVKRTLPELSHHQICFSADYKKEFAQIFTDRIFPDDPTIYVNCPSRNDWTTVPGEGEALFVMANAPANDGNEWDGNKIANARHRIFNRLRRSGFPDIERDILVEDVWTPNRIASARRRDLWHAFARLA